MIQNIVRLSFRTCSSQPTPKRSVYYLESEGLLTNISYLVLFGRALVPTDMTAFIHFTDLKVTKSSRASYFITTLQVRLLILVMFTNM